MDSGSFPSNRRKVFIKSKEQKRHFASLSRATRKQGVTKLSAKHFKPTRKRWLLLFGVEGGGGNLCVWGASGSKHKLVLEGHAFPVAVIGGLPSVTRILWV